MKKPRNTKMVDGLQYNQCTKCAKWFPASRDYFYWYNKGRKILESRCIQCAKDYDAATAERTKEYSKRYREKNKDRIKAYSRWYCKKNKGKRREEWREYSRKAHIAVASFKIYASQLTIEESPLEGPEDQLLVKCAYCGKYFPATVREVNGRIQSLKYAGGGESRLYCSKGCKNACPIYNMRVYPKGYKQATSREVDPIVRKMCLERDNYTCQRCGKTIEEVELHCHHIEGAIQQPMISNDVDNTITLCKKCHKWVHKQKGCTYNDLKCK